MSRPTDEELREALEGLWYWVPKTSAATGDEKHNRYSLLSDALQELAELRGGGANGAASSRAADLEKELQTAREANTRLEDLAQQRLSELEEAQRRCRELESELQGAGTERPTNNAAPAAAASHETEFPSDSTGSKAGAERKPGLLNKLWGNK